jgi:uncharacterized membrane protein YkvA (DUF1232 family)
MTPWSWLGLVVGVMAVVYAAFIATLMLLGSRENARAVAGFVPDCTVLLARLLRDPSMPRRRWLILGLVTAYLATPIDLVPDFIPVIGYLDDAIVVALTLRWLLKTAGRGRLADLWPGPPSSLTSLLKLAEGRTARTET